MTGSVGNGRHILMVVENLPVPFDRRVWQEATTLRQAGYAVTVICPRSRDYPAAHEVLEGVHIQRHPLPLEAGGVFGYLLEYGSALFWQTLLAWRLFLRHRFHAIHACNPPDLVFLVALPFKLLGVRFLFDQHDLCPEVYEAKFGRRGPFYRLLRLCERLTFALADVVIATNESYRRVAVGRGRVDPERVHVVRSGPDLERLCRVPPDERLKRGRRYLVGYVGVMGRQEGIDLLLEAVRYLVHDQGRRDIQFALVGGGTELEPMRRLAERLGVADWVTFTGRVSDAELVRVLGSAEVCVNPDPANALNDQSTMNKVMEYMALGKPMVQFDLTEGRWSAQSASLYARRNDPHDLADKLAMLLDDSLRRVWMGAFGRRRVEEHLAWPHEVPKLLAAYRALFGEGGRVQDSGAKIKAGPSLARKRE